MKILSVDAETNGMHGRPAPDALHCVTQDPREPAGPAFLAVCDDRPVDVMTSRFCPDGECGGHPICGPCRDLSRSSGLAR